MLALWFSDVVTNPSVVLEQINTNAKRALTSAQKSNLSQSLRVDSENRALADRAWEIIDILKKLNIRSFLQEHDYLGQLYETFFRYTGGNTIGQYFTPRHIIDMMCELVAVSPKDVVFDPACGTGGFLIGALRRMIRLQNLSYENAISKVRKNIFGIESEPSTAALCITNMILRGDGKSGIIRANCFARRNYPSIQTDVALLNPPFPHKKKTDTPTTDFIDRAMLNLRNKGLVASIVPYSLLVKVGEWHRRILRNNKLLFVATLPPDLFDPYATFNTAIIVLQKGIRHGNSRVLFARLWNDGYKLKKKFRVSQDGSQINEILEAFEHKTSKPELTVHEPISTETREWSPEAFIRSAPRNDVEFIVGLEGHIRRTAAFYITEGHRLLRPSKDTGTISVPRVFSRKSSLSLVGVTMGSFNVSDYFYIKLGGKDEIEDLADDGTTPIVSTSEFNNGVTAWKRARFTYPPSVITVATDGSTCSSFVQEFPFYAFYKVAILRPKQEKFPIDAM